MIHLLQVRFLFFNSLSTVVGLMCKTRAVSRKARNSLSYRMCKRWDTPTFNHARVENFPIPPDF